MRCISIPMIIGTIVVISLLACGGKQVPDESSGMAIQDGWIDEDTFRVSARGTPVSLYKDVEERKKSSERAAILNARYSILDKFKNYKMKSSSGIEEFEMTGTAIAQELKARVQEGKVKKATWDDRQNCDVVYEVFAPGLKRKVAAAEWKEENN